MERGVYSLVMSQMVIIPAHSVWHFVCKSAIINMALTRGLEFVSGKCNVQLGVQVKSFFLAKIECKHLAVLISCPS